MSADLLRRAAEVLRAHVGQLPDDDRDNWSPYCRHGWLGGPVGEFAALMHPPVALALAAWLERSAPIVASYVGTEWEAQTEFLAREPLAVARAILREPEVTP